MGAINLLLIRQLDDIISFVVLRVKLLPAQASVDTGWDRHLGAGRGQHVCSAGISPQAWCPRMPRGRHSRTLDQLGPGGSREGPTGGRPRSQKVARQRQEGWQDGADYRPCRPEVTSLPPYATETCGPKQEPMQNK